MKLSDYIAEFLVKQNIKHIFGITGGAIVHIFDSIGKRNDINYICPQHEQTVAMAADAYSRITKKIGVGIVTSGPGATNLLTGVGCSYYDSIPVLFITGQVSRHRLRKDKKVRQLGFQETDVIDIFKPITKYAVLIEDPKKIKYELEKAIHIAKSGRPGPVLLDIPDDVQREEINPEELESYIPEHLEKKDISNEINECIKLIEKSKRPIVILGAGVKLGKAEEKAMDFIKKLKFPVALTWATRDMLLQDDILNAGGFGITSQRYGNFAIQNSDLVIGIGTRLDTHHTGTPVNMFAREAKKIIIDIDESELDKFQDQIDFDVLINADVNDFFDKIKSPLEEIETQNILDWIFKINNWKKTYPSYNSSYPDNQKIDAYAFLEELSKKSSEGDIIITDAGGNLAQTMGGYEFRKKQTLFSAFNHSPMGYSFPASIGACFANNKKPIICIIGDGGLQMNIQELATMAHHKLPIKLFIFNNKGYGMIQQTQEDWLNSKYEASCCNKGIANPDFVEIGKAYGLKSERISNHRELKEKLPEILNSSEPVLCELEINPNQRVVPMLKVGRPIEDAKPLLPREEFLENMIIKPLDICLKNEND